MCLEIVVSHPRRCTVPCSVYIGDARLKKLIDSNGIVDAKFDSCIAGELIVWDDTQCEYNSICFNLTLVGDN
jgi:hypothetical protein